jgi:hypothetical protein
MSFVMEEYEALYPVKVSLFRFDAKVTEGSRRLTFENGSG